MGYGDFWNGYTRWWHAGYNNSTPSMNGWSNGVTGTAGARSMVATNAWFGQLPRISYTTAATNNATAGTRHAASEYWRGDAAGLGGFFYGTRFCLSENSDNAGYRFFAGLLGVNSAIAGGTEPTTLTNCIAMVKDTDHTTMRIVHNDASGACTEIDLGANFPATTNQTDVYDFYLYAKPNASSVFYEVHRRSATTGAITHTASGEITTDLPAATQRLAPQLWCGTATGSPVASAFDCMWQTMWTNH
jgi:hypothetical protein